MKTVRCSTQTVGSGHAHHGFAGRELFEDSPGAWRQTPSCGDREAGTV